MRFPAAAVASLAALALSCASAGQGPSAAPATPDAAATAQTPEELLPGVDLSAFSPAQREVLASWARATFCACGCPHTVSSCLAGHKTCKHAGRMVQLASGLVAKGATLTDVNRIVQNYYAGFDRRKRLDVTDFGPPLGDPEAKITIVVVSDFTCPFCKLFVPTIEQFAKQRPGVRLFAKPFPIASHPGSDVAAETGEWAREKGLYWDLQSLLYAADEAPTEDGMAALVRRLGGDTADLREALASGRYRQRVLQAQVEARDAGLTGTPTVFVNGRKIEDLSEDGLRFALDDEEEWVAHGGWAHD
jgi:protein-disulfide isomerase